jgi:hypothetical protein
MGGIKTETVSVEEAFDIVIQGLGSMPIHPDLVNEMQGYLLGLEAIKVGTIKIIGDSKRVIVQDVEDLKKQLNID